MAGGDLVAHVATFAGALRSRGVHVGLGDEVDAVRALTLVDVPDRSEVHRALRIAMKILRRDWAAFDESFARFWAAVPPVRHDSRDTVPSPRPAGAALLRPSMSVEGETSRPGGSPAPPEEGSPGYSPEAVLRRKPFDQCSDADLHAMERPMRQLARGLAVRRSRRLVPARRRETADLRRSFRRSIGTGGELVSLAYRARAIEWPRLVVLCDTSGSMDRHARFLLAFVVALRRVARSTEVFVFNTALARVTGSIASGRIPRIVERLVSAVPDWSGGTRIGESLGEFVSAHLDRFVTHKTVVIILSDGLDRGDTTRIAAAMKAIRSRARRIIWLNPLAGDPRYEPTARAMAAARPFIDRLLPAHDLESLERLLPELA